LDKRLLVALSTATWVTMIGIAAAQPSLPKATQQNPGTVTGGNGNYIVIGCIAREGQGAAPTYTITDTRATPPAQYRLDGDQNLLRVHVGHTLEIGGPLSATSDTSNRRTLKATAVTYISPTCLKLK
jgi:hypothetical protein